MAAAEAAPKSNEGMTLKVVRVRALLTSRQVSLAVHSLSNHTMKIWCKDSKKLSKPKPSNPRLLMLYLRGIAMQWNSTRKMLI